MALSVKNNAWKLWKYQIQTYERFKRTHYDMDNMCYFRMLAVILVSNFWENTTMSAAVLCLEVWVSAVIDKADMCDKSIKNVASQTFSALHW